jgi:hypothetical protein
VRGKLPSWMLGLVGKYQQEDGSDSDGD